MKGKRIVLYTDGSCYAKHPEKLGGFGYRWELWDDSLGTDCLVHSHEGNAGYKNTTIARMEARAMHYGLLSIPYKLPLYLVADSEYLVDGINGGSIYEWADEPDFVRANVDLYRALVRTFNELSPALKAVIHVRGHGKEKKHTWAIAGNKRADELADYKQFIYYEDDSNRTKII